MNRAPLLPLALPEKRRVKRMHVVDAGESVSGCCVIQFVCSHCDYATGWIEDQWSLSQNNVATHARVVMRRL